MGDSGRIPTTDDVKHDALFKADDDVKLLTQIRLKLFGCGLDLDVALQHL